MTTAEALLAAPFATLADLLRAHAAGQGDHIAAIEGEQRTSYRELDAQADRVCAALQCDGVGRGGAIAVLAANSTAYLGLLLGALRAGAVPAPLPPSATPETLATMIADSGASHVFADAAGTARLGAPPDARFVDLDALDEWTAGAGQAEPVTVGPDDAFNIIYSSGTTGTPKGIVHSHAMRWAHIQRGRITGYAPDAVTLISTPFYSNTTLVSLIPALAFGGTVVLMPRFDAHEFLQLAERHRVTHAMLVPVQYRRIMAVPDFDRFDLSAFRMKSCTSAPFAAELKADILARWPGGLVEIYGMTEGGATATLAAHLFPDKLHTVGRPVEGHVMLLIDEAGQPVAQGEVGEVVGRSPAMMTGYHNRPEQTAAAEWFDAEGRRHIRTGDIGRFDADGFLTLLDRKKDVIISGGFNIYPSDLEAVLAGHPDVAEAAVIGVPSTVWGETPVGFATPRDGRVVDAEALRAWANERLGKTQRLAEVVPLDSLPRSAIGKVLKRDLMTIWEARTLRSG